MKKRKSLANLKKDVWKVFSVYIRTRDCLLTTDTTEYGECISCDTPPQHLRTELHAGHYFHNWGDFNEKNINAQCAQCNTFKHGNQHFYREGLIKRYGYDVAAELEKERALEPIKKYTHSELENMKEDFKERIKELNDNNSC